MKSHSRQSIYLTVLSCFLVIIIWLTMAPAQLGGPLTYVIVDGNSMEPRFHLGDLIIVRKEATYQVGDAVTYQNAELGSFVFHRITGLELDRFILQGDNNSWLDSYHPSQKEIIGKLWVHIPKLGILIEWARIPVHLAIIVGLFGGVLMAGMIKQPSRRTTGSNNQPSDIFGGVLAGIFIVIGIFALIFLSLGVFAFTRPLTRAADSIQYQQEGSFFYSAIGTPGIYDTTTVHAGEPIFPNLTCLLNVGFNYNLLAAQSQGTSGTYQMYARLLDEQSGWQRTIPLVPQTDFTSNAYLTIAAVDLCQVESLVDLVEQETGLHSNFYTLEIVSQVAITSNVAGTQINDTFEPSMVFKFDKVHFFIASGNEGLDQLHSSKTGIVNSSALEANTLFLLGWQSTVQFVRGISLLGLGLAVGTALIPSWFLYNRAKQNQDALIQLKYGGLLMDVHEGNLEPYRQIIDVASIDDLARLAERQNMMILHMRLNFLHYYLIQIDGTIYRYLITTGRKGMIEAESARQNAPAYAFDPNQYRLHEARPPRQETPYYVVNTYETEERPQYPGDVTMLKRIKI
jgi:signal peptidase I